MPFADKEPKAQSGEVHSPSSHSMLVAELGPEEAQASRWSSIQLCSAAVNFLHRSIYKVLSKMQAWTRDWLKEGQPGKQAWQLPITSAHWSGPGGSKLLSARDTGLVLEQYLGSQPA